MHISRNIPFFLNLYKVSGFYLSDYSQNLAYEYKLKIVHSPESISKFNSSLSLN